MLKNLTYYQKFWALTLTLALIRIIAASFVNLVPQEAYYWLYIQRPDFGYFDHPPMSSYSIGIFTSLFGDNEFAVRFGAVLFSIGASLFTYKLAEKLYSSKVAFYSTIFLNLTLFFNMQAAPINTPDSPLLFFWSLTVYYLYKTFFEESSYINWALSGLFAGFALFSKYTAVFLFLSAFIFLIINKNSRKELFTFKPLTSAIFAVIGFLPVIYWNYIHDLASFKFQSATRAKGMTSFTLNYFFQLIGSQFLELTPFIFVLFFALAYKLAKKYISEKDEKTLFIISFSFPLIGFFVLVSFLSLVKMNWLLPGYITLIVPFGYYYGEKAFGTWSKINGWKFGFASSLLIVVAAMVLWLFPILSFKGDTWNGWKEYAFKVDSIKIEMEKSNKTFIFSDEYKASAELAFYTKHKDVILAQNTIGETALQFDYWKNPNDFIGYDAILVGADFNKAPNIEKIKKYFHKVEEITPYQFISGGKTFRTFWIYKCYGYKGADTARH